MYEMTNHVCCEKIRKNTIKLSTAELAQRVEMVKQLSLLSFQSQYFVCC